MSSFTPEHFSQWRNPVNAGIPEPMIPVWAGLGLGTKPRSFDLARHTGSEWQILTARFGWTTPVLEDLAVICWQYAMVPKDYL